MSISNPGNSQSIASSLISSSNSSLRAEQNKSSSHAPKSTHEGRCWTNEIPPPPPPLPLPLPLPEGERSNTFMGTALQMLSQPQQQVNVSGNLSTELLNNSVLFHPLTLNPFDLSAEQIQIPVSNLSKTEPVNILAQQLFPKKTRSSLVPHESSAQKSSVPYNSPQNYLDNFIEIPTARKKVQTACSACRTSKQGCSTPIYSQKNSTMTCLRCHQRGIQCLPPSKNSKRPIKDQVASQSSRPAKKQQSSLSTPSSPFAENLSLINPISQSFNSTPSFSLDLNLNREHLQTQVSRIHEIADTLQGKVCSRSSSILHFLSAINTVAIEEASLHISIDTCKSIVQLRECAEQISLLLNPVQAISAHESIGL